MQHEQHPFSLKNEKPTKDTKIATIHGDLILGGLFSLHRRYLDRECVNHTSRRNILRVEAMMYAVEEVKYLSFRQLISITQDDTSSSLQIYMITDLLM